jgi:hypothetical protein
MPTVRKNAEEFSRKEGASLNQFIKVAVAEKVAVLQQVAWAASRQKPTPERIAQLLAFFDEQKGVPPEPWDELPEGYISIRESEEYKRLLQAK